MRDLQANEERVTNINVMKDTLVEGHHSCTEQITERCNTINSMWFEVRELAQARHEVNCVSPVKYTSGILLEYFKGVLSIPKWNVPSFLPSYRL